MQEEIHVTKAFTMIPNEIMDNPDIDIYMQSVLLALYRFRNQENNTCFPSYVALAQYAKCCVRKAKSIVKQLEKMGLIQVCRRSNGRLQAHASNVYILPSMKMDAPTEIEETDEKFSLANIVQSKEKQVKDYHASYARPYAQQTHPNAYDALPYAPDAPNKELSKNNIYTNPSIHHSFLNERNELMADCTENQNHFQLQRQSQKQNNAQADVIALQTRAGLAKILDEHFDYIENFSIQENTIRTLYQSLRTYMIEMLMDETTTIDHCAETREELAALIFSANSITLLDFINHIYKNGSKETIIHPRAYLKKCWIDYIRSSAIQYRNVYADYNLPNNNTASVDKDCLRTDQSLCEYHSILRTSAINSGLRIPVHNS